MNSATGPSMNKDISNILNDEELTAVNKSPVNIPPKPISNPFTVNT